MALLWLCRKLFCWKEINTTVLRGIVPLRSIAFSQRSFFYIYNSSASLRFFIKIHSTFWLTETTAGCPSHFTKIIKEFESIFPQTSYKYIPNLHFLLNMLRKRKIKTLMSMFSIRFACLFFRLFVCLFVCVPFCPKRTGDYLVLLKETTKFDF